MIFVSSPKATIKTEFTKHEASFFLLAQSTQDQALIERFSKEEFDVDIVYVNKAGELSHAGDGKRGVHFKLKTTKRKRDVEPPDEEVPVQTAEPVRDDRMPEFVAEVVKKAAKKKVSESNG